MRNAEHKVYPYLLRNLETNRVNQVWASDITYLPMRHGFLYLCVVMDWYTRKVLSWRLSNTLTTDFCVDALKDALERYGKPEIFNTDQGSQFTSKEFTSVLQAWGINISMDGKGRWRDNVIVERFWRTIKYDEVYLHAYEDGADAKKAWQNSSNFIMKGGRIKVLTGRYQILCIVKALLSRVRLHSKIITLISSKTVQLT